MTCAPGRATARSRLLLRIAGPDHPARKLRLREFGTKQAAWVKLQPTDQIDDEALALARRSTQSSTARSSTTRRSSRCRSPTSCRCSCTARPASLPALRRDDRGRPLALAKEVTSATVCGAGGCRSMDGAGEELLQGRPAVNAPSQREPFVRLEFRFAAGRETGRVRNIFLPRSGLLLGDDAKTWLQPTELATLRRHAGAVVPFAASRLPATVPLAPPEPDPAAAASPRALSSGDRLRAWWPVLLAAALAIAVGTALGRRFHRRGTTDAPT